LEAIRASAKLPPLKRVAPSVAERELVCTAAVTGRTVHDPVFGNLGTYVTRDLLAETEPLKVVALGTSACRTPQPCAESDARYKVYSDKDSGRYSVIVERNPNSTPDQPVYTVGVARRASALKEFFAQITFDNPIKDSNEGKKQVAPECRNLAY
jgi:hypothetical protein